MHMSQLEQKQSKPWWLHVLAIAIGLVACLCIVRYGYAWGGSIAAAAGALIFPAIIYYRKGGKPHRFWVTVMLLTLVQIPLVIAVRPLVEQFQLVFMIVFAVADCVFVAFALNWMCSREKLR
jgi:hypothetical protein